MSRFLKNSIFAMTVLTFVLMASNSFAANCGTPLVNGQGTLAFNIAVASNFYGPAQDLIANYFQKSQDGTDTAVTICEDSTGTLVSEIQANSTLYGMFFAADTRAGLFGSDFTYAYGVPVLFSNTAAITSVSQLISTAPAPINGVSTIDYIVSSADALNIAKVAKVAIADPVAAPYGNAACQILKDMGYSAYSSVTCPGVPPSGSWPTSWLASTYPNITQTYNSVIPNGPNTSGFISKAQVCTAIGTTNMKVIEFTDNKYMLNQTAVLLPYASQGAVNLNNYIQSVINTGIWDTFLNNNCYK